MLSHEEIRILTIWPAPSKTNASSPIECDLGIVSLSNSPYYETLSYVWGLEKPSIPITITHRTVKISPTLHHALLRLRLPDRKRMVWIDQLCIQQDNKEEKAQQVQLMRKIYMSCAQCVIWMGEIKEDVSLAEAEGALELLRCLGEIARAEDRDGVLVPPSVRDNSDALCKALKGLSYDGNQWWRRVWTVQEAVLPQRLILQWGPLNLPWEVIEDCASTLEYDNPIQETLSHEGQEILNNFLCHIVWLEISKSQASTPYELIQRWRFRNASNPRDKIYGLLGMCEAGRLPTTELCDYTISITQLLCTLTVELILDEGGLRALTPYLRPDASSNPPGLPSWVPDFTCTRLTDVPDQYYQMHGYDYYSADNGMDEIDLDAIRSQIGQEILRLSGFCIDKVRRVKMGYRKPSEGTYVSETEDLLRSWYNTAMGDDKVTDQEIYPHHPQGEYNNRAEAFARLVLGDFIRDDQQRPCRRASETDIQDVWKVMDLQGSTVEYGTRYTIYGMMENQTMFVTESGLMGIGHLDTQVGDEVWVFKGGNVPFTIRPRSAMGESDYSFLGHCYVQGIMFGEVAEGNVAGVNLVERTACLW